MRLAIYHLPSSYDPQPLDIGSSCYRRAYAETPSTSVGSHVTQWACSKEKQRHDSEGARSLDSQCLQKLGNIFILLTLHLDSHVTFVRANLPRHPRPKVQTSYTEDKILTDQIHQRLSQLHKNINLSSILASIRPFS